MEGIKMKVKATVFITVRQTCTLGVCNIKLRHEHYNEANCNSVSCI